MGAMGTFRGIVDYLLGEHCAHHLVDGQGSTRQNGHFNAGQLPRHDLNVIVDSSVSTTYGPEGMPPKAESEDAE